MVLVRGASLVLLVATSSCFADSLDLGQRRDAVIGGEATPQGVYPATGALVRLDPDTGVSQFTCSGTLIAPDVVVTAAHCVDPDFGAGEEPPSFTLALNALTAPASEIVQGVVAIKHPMFSLWDNPGYGVSQWHDIGIVILKEQLWSVPFELLPSKIEDESLAPELGLELVGYGMTDMQRFSSAGVKHHGDAELVEVGSHELLVSNPGEQQNCSGDSGGPALAQLSGGRRLVGVVSRSPDRDPICDHGGIDTRIGPYLEWIDSEVGGLPCGTGLSEPCVHEGGCAVAGTRSSPLALLCLLALTWLTLRRKRGAARIRRR